MSIIAKNISKSFDNKEVLNDININIKDGEIFGLLGPSGAGKTTLIKILTGQIKPSSGSATLLGSDVNCLPKEVYKNIGMVYENSGLYTRISCFDNLYIFANIYGVEKENVISVLNKVGLGDCIHRPVQNLSTGMRQRLIIARAIMHNPKVLFLDEPTSGLDPINASNIHNIIGELREQGTTVFITTHNMVEATKLCDNIALLCDGKIIEYGSPQSICFKHNKNKRVQVFYNGTSEILEWDEAFSSKIMSISKEYNIDSIHSLEPNLEDVFVKLTGKELV